MGSLPVGRRERLRAETLQGIKESARQQLSADGAAALSLRAITRDLGMAPAAIYNYFSSREELLLELAADAYAELDAYVTASRDDCAPEDTAGRLVAHGLAYRRWAVTHPEKFDLLYARSAIAGLPPASHAATAAEHRFCLGLIGLVTNARDKSEASAYTWTDFDEPLVAKARAAYSDLVPAVLARTLRVLGRMHGLVALEVAGVLGPRAADPESLYRDELRDLARSLELDGTS